MGKYDHMQHKYEAYVVLFVKILKWKTSCNIISTTKKTLVDKYGIHSVPWIFGHKQTTLGFSVYTYSSYPNVSHCILCKNTTDGFLSMLQTLTIAFPSPSPFSILMKAAGMFSKPSVTTSFAFSLPCRKTIKCVYIPVLFLIHMLVLFYAM